MRLAFQCKQWGALPEEGGLLDQAPGQLEKMDAVYGAYETITSRQNARDVNAWTDANPKRFEYYSYLKILAKYGPEEAYKRTQKNGAK